MHAEESPRQFSKFYTFASFVLVVAVLRAGRDIIVPLALAALLAFLLSPLVNKLRRWGLPKALAIVATVTIAFGILVAVGWIVGNQVGNLIQELPRYEQNLHKKIEVLRSPNAPEALSRTGRMIERLEDEIQMPPETAPPEHPRDGSATPVPVEVKPSKPTSLGIAREVLSSVVSPLGTAGIVIVFVIAMLFQGKDLTDRIIRVAGAGRVGPATHAMDDAAERVSRYLAMQLMVNLFYGVPIGIGLYFIGVPNALLWGMLATTLRFIPFLGPWIAAAFPLTLAVVIDPGWTKMLETFGLIVAMETVTTNLVEPLLYGSSTGVSGLALMVAAVFWTWTWGIPGLFLSTPLTVCLMVLGKYVRPMRYLSTLLGSEPIKGRPAG